MTLYTNIMPARATAYAISIMLLLSAFFVATSARAQTDIPDLGLDEFSAPSVELITTSGGTPGSSATIAAKTSNIDDNSVSFEWYLDDQPMLAKSGRAKTSFSFITTKPFHVVRLSIIENGKKIAENAASIASFNVSLTWRASTFIPADYEGKAMPIVGSTVTLTAFPDIKGEAPDNLLYTWSVDAESVVRNILGEQEFSFMVMKNVSFVFVSVEVSTLNQSITITKAVNIPLSKPHILLEPNTSVFLFPGEKTEFAARPYYFNIASAMDLQYEWTFVGKSILGIPPDPNMLTLAIPPDSGTGSQMLTVNAENRKTPGEKGRASLEINIL